MLQTPLANHLSRPIQYKHKALSTLLQTHVNNNVIFPEWNQGEGPWMTYISQTEADTILKERLLFDKEAGNSLWHVNKASSLVIRCLGNMSML